jgi:phage shock protein PspC (stress-responsive transcriptional regulator)
MVARGRASDPVAMTTEHTHTLENGAAKRLERSRSDRMVAGVSGGLARYFNIHPAFYRVGFVVLTLLGGAGIVIYAAAALVIPDEGKEDSVATAALRDRRDRPWPLIGLGLVAVAGAILLSRATLWPHGDAWFLLLLAGGVILWVTRHGTTAEAPADAPTAEGPAVDGAAARAAEDSRRVRRVFRNLLIAFGTLFALVLVAAAIFAAVFHVHLGHGVGDRNYAVSSPTELRQKYQLGIGDLNVDLRDLSLPAGETHVQARVDVGNLEVVVPRNAAVEVHGDAQVGRVEVLGRIGEGRDVDRSVVQNGRRVLVLDAHVGAGRVVVTRAVR